jgi:hypothetical protein
MAEGNKSGESVQRTPAAPRGAATTARVRWDDSRMQSSYANVVNVSSTREEMVLLFGVNQTWTQGQPEVKIDLSHRIILSPFAAKRLSVLLTQVLGEYERRFGALDAGQRSDGSES